MAALKNTRHEAFAQALAKGMSADAAYQKAGYKPSRSAASRLSTNVNISGRVAELVSKGAERTEITIGRVLEELARIGFADLRQCFTPEGGLIPVRELPDSIAHAIAAVEVVTKPGEADADGNRIVEYVHKIKLWDKNSALEKIAKHLGMFIERVEHTGKDGQPIEVTDRSNKERARRILSLIAQAELDGHD